MSTGCTNDGRLITYETIPTQITRASDQAILADAIDDGFGKLDNDKIRTALGANASLSAYLVIASPFNLDASVLNYIQEKAALQAGAIGLRILELRTTLERPNPERTLEVVETEFPDTEARVMILVSYAGVDEVTTIEQQESHGTTKPDRILEGRFKATFAVTPRKTSFPAYSQVIEGKSSYEVGYRQFIDER
ncbi:MAG: hypothetical protein AUK47_01230 [Deltaproteobacteria bacterium CG2_30_63_29]|nr:MAG: hypothetical protein AUK47_01230 [Deltaproteobacteria bacterium CG2_30_63_29]